MLILLSVLLITNQKPCQRGVTLPGLVGLSQNDLSKSLRNSVHSRSSRPTVKLVGLRVTS